MLNTLLEIMDNERYPVEHCESKARAANKLHFGIKVMNKSYIIPIKNVASEFLFRMKLNAGVETISIKLSILKVLLAQMMKLELQVKQMFSSELIHLKIDFILIN